MRGGVRRGMRGWRRQHPLGGGWCECEGVREEVTLGGGGEYGTPGRNRGSVAVAVERR